MDSSISNTPALLRDVETMLWAIRTKPHQLPHTRQPSVCQTSPSSAARTRAVPSHGLPEKTDTANSDTFNHIEPYRSRISGRIRKTFQKLLEKSLAMLAQAKQTLMAHILLVQSATILLSVILSAMVFFPLGTITSNLGGQCLLFSKLCLTVTDFSLNNPATFNLTGTEFGPIEECDYTTFLNVTVTVAGLIFLWFLIHLGRVSEFERSEPGFMVSLFLFYLVLFICVLVSSVKISSGFSYWCDNIQVCIGNKVSSTDCRKLACDQFSHVTLEDIPEDTSRFYAYFLTAQISSWLLTVTLLFELFVTSQRIYQTVSAEFVEETTTSQELDTPVVSSVSLKTGIINLASDELVEEKDEAAQFSGSPEVAKRTLAKVTVHAEKATSNIEMSAVGKPPDVQILPENEDTLSKTQRSELVNEESDNSHVTLKSRKRKTAKNNNC